MKNKKICFCYSGEGARGSIQAGITKSLVDSGIVPDVTIGVSSGSVCASSYSYLGSNGLVDLWKSIDSVLDVFGLNYNFLWKSGFLNSKPLQKRVNKIVNDNPLCESIVSKLNIETGEVRYVSNKSNSKQEFIDSVVASISITTLVEDKDGWVDAGSRVLAPIDRAVALGCSDIYIITGRPMQLAQWTKPSGWLSLFKLGLRALDISLYELMLRDINNWINNPEKIEQNNVNITLLQPKGFVFESTQFSHCPFGVQYGLTEYESYNPSQMQMLFGSNYGMY
ncbi:MAG: patatin-like phospholipase family protein [Candidatus Nitrosotenuis sp.]